MRGANSANLFAAFGAATARVPVAPIANHGAIRDAILSPFALISVIRGLFSCVFCLPRLIRGAFSWPISSHT